MCHENVNNKQNITKWYSKLVLSRYRGSPKPTQLLDIRKKKPFQCSNTIPNPEAAACQLL